MNVFKFVAKLQIYLWWYKGYKEEEMATSNFYPIGLWQLLEQHLGYGCTSFVYLFLLFFSWRSDILKFLASNSHYNLCGVFSFLATVLDFSQTKGASLPWILFGTRKYKLPDQAEQLGHSLLPVKHFKGKREWLFCTIDGGSLETVPILFLCFKFFRTVATKCMFLYVLCIQVLSTIFSINKIKFLL